PARGHAPRPRLAGGAGDPHAGQGPGCAPAVDGRGRLGAGGRRWARRRRLARGRRDRRRAPPRPDAGSELRPDVDSGFRPGRRPTADGAHTAPALTAVLSDRDDAAVVPEPLALDTGARIGRYLILERVGSGAMGVVYGAYDPELDRKIALKLLSEQRGQDETARARLLREAKATARLAHPNVIAVHD